MITSDSEMNKHPTVFNNGDRITLLEIKPRFAILDLLYRDKHLLEYRRHQSPGRHKESVLGWQPVRGIFLRLRITLARFLDVGFNRRFELLNVLPVVSFS